MAHHHLAIAVIFIIAGHMYRTNFGIGHSIKEILNAHNPPAGTPAVQPRQHDPDRCGLAARLAGGHQQPQQLTVLEHWTG
jgi:hypothetical protein